MVDLPMHHNLHTSIWNVLATLNGTTIYGRPSMQNPCPHTSKSWLRHPPTSSSLSSPEITRLFLSWPQSWCNWNTQYCCTGSTLYKNTLPTSFPFCLGLGEQGYTEGGKVGPEEVQSILCKLHPLVIELVPGTHLGVILWENA